MKKISSIVGVVIIVFGIYFILSPGLSEKIPFLPQKEIHSWTSTSYPSKFKYFCDSGYIESSKLMALPGGKDYTCSDGSQVKSIRELTVKCKTGYPEYNSSLSKSIPYKCNDGSEIIIETHSYPRYETILCQRKGEEPYREELYIKDANEKRVCSSPGNPEFIEVIDVF